MFGNAWLMLSLEKMDTFLFLTLIDLYISIGIEVNAGSDTASLFFLFSCFQAVFLLQKNLFIPVLSPLRSFTDKRRDLLRVYAKEIPDGIPVFLIDFFVKFSCSLMSPS